MSSIVAGKMPGLLTANVMVAFGWPIITKEAGFADTCEIETAGGALAVHVTFRFTTGAERLKVNEPVV